MTAEISRYNKTHHTTAVMPSKPAESKKKPLKAVDQNVTIAVQGTIKGHQTQKPLSEKVKGRAKANAIENESNIFQHLLNCKKLNCNAQDIAAAVRHCARRASDKKNPVGAEEAKDIRKFFDKISNLDSKLFDRNALLGGRVALQCLLSHELDGLMKQEKVNSALKNDTTHQLNLAIAKAKLSVNLGHGIESAKQGENGTVLVKSLENEYVGVFKAPPKVKWFHFKTHLKKYMGQARLLNQKDGLGQQFAEVAAHKMDKAMGFNMAPSAALAEIKGQQGAFIAFLKGYKELKSVEAALQARHAFTAHEKKVWQMMCVFNFLTGNMDPHAENIFVKTDDAGKIGEIRVIDAGNSFIEKNPGSWGSKGNQGHWGKYNISKEEFVPEVREFIQNHLTEENFREFVKEIGMQREEFWSQEMDHNQRMRLEVLKSCVAKGKIQTPEALARIHTQQDYRNLLKDVEVKSNSNSVHRFEDGFTVVDFV